MKAIITILLLLTMSEASNGAVSGDMTEYVRKEVFEVHMQSINAKLDMIVNVVKEVRDEQERQRKDINDLTKAVSVMSERIDRNFETLSARVDGLDARMGDLRNDIYLGLVILGILVGVPSVQKWYERLKASRPAITLEDVKRLIEENNAELMKTLKG